MCNRESVPEEGDVVKARVLDVDYKLNVVDLSLAPRLLVKAKMAKVSTHSVKKDH